MPLSLGDKTSRVIRFLWGVRNPRMATALTGYGFTDEDRLEGWNLIYGLGRGKMLLLPSVPRDTATLLKLDAWENQWFPIAEATLTRRFPAAAARFFLNLVQTEGPEVAITVRTFVDRYDELAAGDEKYGAEAKKAHQLLVTRGVTAAIVDEARAMLTAVTQVAGPSEPLSLEQQAAELEAAEAAMWDWYLEWSKIARIAIKQRVLLKEMGFLVPRRGGEDEEEVEAAPATTSPVAPTA